MTARRFLPPWIGDKSDGCFLLKTVQ